MLYELASDKVDRFIFLPFLEDIYSEPDKEKSYWNFLRYGFAEIGYTIFDKDIIEKYYKDASIVGSRNLINTPSTVILIKMLRILGIQTEFIKDYNGEPVNYPECETSVYLSQEVPKRKKDGKRRISVLAIPVEFFRDTSRFEKSAISDFSDKDEAGNSLEIGHDYSVDVSRIIDDPEKYTRLKVLLENEKTELKQMYHRLEQYYLELKEKYKDSGNLDDDDF